jgi:H+-transporting ATPase
MEAPAPAPPTRAGSTLDLLHQRTNYGGDAEDPTGPLLTPEALGNLSEQDKAEAEQTHAAVATMYKFRPEGLTEEEVSSQRKAFGLNKLPSTEIPVWRQVLSLLTQPMALMMWVAAVIEALIENYPDMGILLGIILTNASISFYEMRKSGNAVATLQGTLKPKATVKRFGKQMEEIDAELLVPGDTVVLAAGSAVPADCQIEGEPTLDKPNHGVITVDQAALTGESLPVKITGANQRLGKPGPLMGTTVMTGEVEGVVQKTGVDTVLGQTASLLDRPPEQSNLDKVLIRIIFVMAGLSVCLSSIVFVFGMWKGEGFKEVLSFTVVLIIASIPMAVEIVTTTTLALGARTLAAEGAIVTRLSSVEDMAAMDMLCSDKTGTLTLNEMVLSAEEDIPTPTFHKDATRETALKYAALAAKWNDPPRDALDTLVLYEKVDETGEPCKPRLKKVLDDELNAKGPDGVEKYEQTDFTPFNPTDKFTSGTILFEGKRTFYVAKGAPDVILKMCAEAGETRENLERAQKVMLDMAQRGIRCLAICRAEQKSDWRLEAMLTFMDPPRPDSKSTIKNAGALGVPVRMITGDHLDIAKETCRQLGLDSNVLGPDELPLLDEEGKPPLHTQMVKDAQGNDTGQTIGGLIRDADGFAQVYPQHKFIIVDVLRQLGYRCGMTGDGVNDAAAMKQADVGVCVKGGTDAARAAADIVLTEPGLSTIVNGMKLARKIFARINNFMTYRLAASMQLLFYFFIAVLTMHPSEYQGEGEQGDEWDYMYGMPVLLLMMITLLNDGALITIGYDNVEGSKRPTVWNIKLLFLVSFVMAAVACASSLLLLHLALDSWREDSFFRMVGIEPMSWGHITTLMYLKVSVSDFLTLFSCRCVACSEIALRLERAVSARGASSRAVLYCAVLCCAVLCCTVLCCAVLCRAVPCRAVLCCAVPCRAVPCCAVLC